MTDLLSEARSFLADNNVNGDPRATSLIRRLLEVLDAPVTVYDTFVDSDRWRTVNTYATGLSVMESHRQEHLALATPLTGWTEKNKTWERRFQYGDDVVVQRIVRRTVTTKHSFRASVNGLPIGDRNTRDEAVQLCARYRENMSGLLRPRTDWEKTSEDSWVQEWQLQLTPQTGAAVRMMIERIPLLD